MSRVLRLPILFLLVFLCWAAPGWAASDEFCGSGIHRAGQGCACQSESLCVCHPDSGETTLVPTLRETLPVALPYVALYAGQAPRLQERRLETGRLLMPSCWSEPPALRPPR